MQDYFPCLGNFVSLFTSNRISSFFFWLFPPNAERLVHFLVLISLTGRLCLFPSMWLMLIINCLQKGILSNTSTSKSMSSCSWWMCSKRNCCPDSRLDGEQQSERTSLQVLCESSRSLLRFLALGVFSMVSLVHAHMLTELETPWKQSFILGWADYLWVILSVHAEYFTVVVHSWSLQMINVKPIIPLWHTVGAQMHSSQVKRDQFSSRCSSNKTKIPKRIE